MKLNNNKAPEVNPINAELIKAGGLKLAKYLQTYQINLDKWNNARIMECRHPLSNIQKRVIHRKQTIYKGIALQNVFYKILFYVIHNWLKSYIETLLGDYQCGFHNTKSTIDQIFIFRQTLDLKEHYEFNQKHA